MLLVYRFSGHLRWRFIETKASLITLLTPYPALADLYHGAPELSQTYLFGTEVNTVLLSLYHLVLSFFLLWHSKNYDVPTRRYFLDRVQLPFCIPVRVTRERLTPSDLFAGRLFLFSYLTMSALFAVIAIGSICPTLLSYTRRLAH